jgi:hypothetical protein
VTPNSGAGPAESFDFVFADPNGNSDLGWAQVLIHSALSPAGSCWVHFDLVDRNLWLMNDAADRWLGPLTNTPLQNSQCKIESWGFTSLYGDTALTLSLRAAFLPGFSGARTIYMQAQDKSGLSSGWQTRGTWTAPGP